MTTRSRTPNVTAAKLTVATLAVATLALGGAVLASGVALAQAQTVTKRPPYGCFRVTAPEINIRKTAFSSGEVLAQAKRGDILIKRKRFCTLRGFWCAVRTAKGVDGYADKSLIKVSACPARLSKPAN